jgi:prevent-host-death family protein
MPTVNMHEAKSQLSKLVQAVESGAEKEIVIARNGKPAVKIIAANLETSKRLGLFDGKYPSVSLEEFNALDAEIAALFYGDDDANPA